jgi:hypothetical protein
MSDEGTHMTNTIKTGLKATTTIKAGGIGVSNHSRKIFAGTGLKATTTIKAGGIGVSNHSRKIAAKRLGHVSGRR